MEHGGIPGPEVLAFLEHVGPQLARGAPVLDAGCGRGRHLLPLARMGLAVCGCDVSPVALASARDSLRRGRATAWLQVADLAHLPYRDAAFGAVLCVHVLPYHRQADLARALGELRRVLRPGAYLYFDLLSLEDAEYGCGPQLEEHTFLDPDGGVPIHFSSREEVDWLLRGLTPLRVARLEAGSSPRLRVGWEVWART